MARSSKKKAAPAKKGGSRSPKRAIRKGLHAPDVQAGQPTRTVQKTPRSALHAPDVQAGRPPRPPQKSSKKVKTAVKTATKKKVVKDSRGRVRDYKKEYARRIARAEVLQRALGAVPNTKGVARGHPRRERGEVGFGEIKQLKRAIRLPSIGQQRDAGETAPVQHELRVIARERLCEIAGVPAEIVESTKATRRSPAVEKFAEAFVGLGLGTLNDAYTLYFSP